MKGNALGIFLFRINYSDTSLIVHFYTREFGLKKFMFKGGKKKGHSLFPMAICDLSFYGRQDSNLWSLNTADPMHGISFQFDAIRSSIAFFMAEVVRKCVIDDEKDEFFFDRLSETVMLLNRQEDCQLFPLEFMLSMSELMGIQPLIAEENAEVFNLDDGVFEERSPSHIRSVDGVPVQLILDLLRQQTPRNSSKMVREEALDIMLDYFRIHVPKFDQLQSYEIVKEVLRG